MTSLTLSAALPNLRPPQCKEDEVCQEADTGQLAILYASLLLMALGSGGIRPCVVAFGAEQFDETDPKQSTKTWRYFNWYYFVMGVSNLLAVTVLVKSFMRGRDAYSSGLLLFSRKRHPLDQTLTPCTTGDKLLNHYQQPFLKPMATTGIAPLGHNW